jgi:DeoR/GlpR family transcriptional regulator of sugar metabolism
MRLIRIERACELVTLAGSSKLDPRGRLALCGFAGVSTIITDGCVSERPRARSSPPGV